MPIYEYHCNDCGTDFEKSKTTKHEFRFAADEALRFVQASSFKHHS
jgi:putative FmdB family regulatory protein